MSKYTVGLTQVKIKDAVESGVISETDLSKSFKVYDDTCEIQHDAPEKTEHKEENNAVPVVVINQKKTPTLKFQVMETDEPTLEMLLGGSAVNDYGSGQTGFGMDGSEETENKYFSFQTVQGMDIVIPNGSITSNLSGKLSKKGIALIDVVVTPMAVTGEGKKPFVMIPNNTRTTTNITPSSGE